MGWIFTIIMIICCMIKYDGSYLIAAAIFAVSGSIDHFAMNLSKYATIEVEAKPEEDKSKKE